MPFVDTLYVTIEKEKVPRKEKFKQGYLDVPEIERPEWGVDFRDDSQQLRRRQAPVRGAGLQVPADDRHLRLVPRLQHARPGGRQGDTPAQQAKNRKLRQALSIAIDWEEGYGRIFLKQGRR